MATFDLIGIQINITDSWPDNPTQRKKLKQTSDYIEIVNDLKECAALAHALTIDLGGIDRNIQQDILQQLKFLKPGLLERSIESSLLSKYGRCFNSSHGRTRLERSLVEKVLNTELLEQHDYMLDRRDKVIAHAEYLDGRQKIRVLNHNDTPDDWRFDNSSSTDFIPRLTTEESRNIELCCVHLANCSNEKAKKSFSSFTSSLTEKEAEKIRDSHHLKDATGSAYAVLPTASSRD